jgi:cytochrome c oxidase subunit 3
MLAGLSTLAVLFGAVIWMADGSPWVFLMGLVGALYVMWEWWGAMIAEHQAGDHTSVVRTGLSNGLRCGVILLILSDAVFFAVWFWAFVKNAIYPMFEYAGTQDAVPHIHAIDPYGVPLINTMLLMCSGCAVTWAHHALVYGNIRKDLITGLAIAIGCGAAFSLFQAYEYYDLVVHEGWSLSGDTLYGAFFMAMGLHGLHVLIGTLVLTVCLVRAMRGHFTPEDHTGFEVAAWYWHFVDVVWLFLFVAICVWIQ